MHKFDIAIIDTIARDESARRELLWLRAKEKGYEEVLLALVDVDPGLPERMRDVEQAIHAGLGETERALAYSRAWDACYAKHAARFTEPG